MQLIKIVSAFLVFLLIAPGAARATPTQTDPIYLSAYTTKCDGMADISGALQNAIDSLENTGTAPKNSGGEIILPAGICVIAGQVMVSGYSIRLVGSSKGIIRLTYQPPSCSIPSSNRGSRDEDRSHQPNLSQ